MYGEEEPTKNYIKLVLAPQMGQGISVSECREFILKLSGNPDVGMEIKSAGMSVISVPLRTSSSEQN